MSTNAAAMQVSWSILGKMDLVNPQNMKLGVCNLNHYLRSWQDK